MAYVKQGFHDGMTLTHTHLINMEEGIIAASQGGVEDIYASSYGVIPGKVDAAKMKQLLADASSNNKTIRFNDGEYIFSATIDIPSNVSLVGNTKTIFKATNATTPSTLMTINSADNVYLSHIILQGEHNTNPRSTEGTQTGLSINSSRSVNIENVEIIGWGLHGLYAKTTSSYGTADEGKFFKQLQITNCRFYFNYIGSYFDYRAEYNQMLNCVWGENGIGTINCGGNNAYVSCQWNANVTGFQMENSGSNPAHGGCNGCTFNHNYSNAILINNCINGWTFEGCQVFYGAIRLNNCQGVVFNGNIWGSCSFISSYPNNFAKNLIANTFFLTSSTAILNGNDGSTTVFCCLPDHLPEGTKLEPENILNDANLTPLFRTITGDKAGASNCYFANTSNPVAANVALKSLYVAIVNASYNTTVPGVNVWVVNGENNKVIEKIVDNQDILVDYSKALNTFVLNIALNKTYNHPVYFIVQATRTGSNIGIAYANGTANSQSLVTDEPKIGDTVTANSNITADISVFAQ